MIELKPCPFCGADMPEQDAGELKTYASISFDDGCNMIAEFHELEHILPQYSADGYTYTVEHVSMTPTQYQALPEFEG